MAMTAAVKDELSRLAVTKPCCRKAEVASVFRYGGSLHIVSGRIAIEAELDTGAAARRLRKDIWEVYSHRAELVVQSPGGLRRGHRYQLRATANRLANFDDANLRRSARAAVAAGARVSRALDILGDDAPEHLAAAGRLRLDHKQASLEELGTLADPPLTKDAIAGRIRRLLAMADSRPCELGVDGTDVPAGG